MSEVRHAFTKHGGNLGTDGSVAYLFTKQGEILLAPTANDERAMDVAIEAGADDVSLDEGQMEVITAVEAYHRVMSALQNSNFELEHSHITMRAQVTIPLEKETAESVEKLIDALEDLDDVQAVYSNAEWADLSIDMAD